MIGKPSTELEAIEKTFRLGLSRSKGIAGYWYEPDDVMQEIAIAIIHAYRTYDESYGSPFSLHAYWQIMRRLSVMRKDVKRNAWMRRFHSFMEEIGIPETERDRIEPDAVEALDKAVSCLPPKKQQIIRQCYGIGGEVIYDQKESAERAGITYKKHRDLKSEAMMALRAMLKGKHI